MHDWKQLVRDSLGGLRLNTRDEADTVAELAGHLEECYEDLLATGSSEQQALEECFRQLSGAGRTARNIERAKCKEGVMNHRSKTLWLPGLVTLTLSSVFLMMLQRFVFLPPRIFWVDEGALVLHLPWLVLLPICGATGAYLSQHAGGGRLNCLLAGLFPVVVMFGAFCLILPIGIVIQRNAYIMHHPLYFGLALLNWTVLPGVALLLGAVAVCGINARRPEAHIERI